MVRGNKKGVAVISTATRFEENEHGQDGGHLGSLRILHGQPDRGIDPAEGIAERNDQGDADQARSNAVVEPEADQQSETDSGRPGRLLGHGRCRAAGGSSAPGSRLSSRRRSGRGGPGRCLARCSTTRRSAPACRRTASSRPQLQPPRSRTTPLAAEHDDGAARVVHAVLADGAKQRRGEPAVPAAAQH
jgi:hypothetical protein